jgi:hypothetical protein
VLMVSANMPLDRSTTENRMAQRDRFINRLHGVKQFGCR